VEARVQVVAVLKIGDVKVGPGESCYIIGEVGLQHDGSLNQAHAFIDALASAGVDAVKFQCHLGDRTSEWRYQPEWSNETRQEYWARTGFTKDEWSGLAQHCEDDGIAFLCSPFSLEAAGMVNPLVPAWKIPSGQVRNTLMLEFIRDTGKPVLCSTGMSTLAEMDEFRRMFPDVQFLQCTSRYPTRAEEVGLFEAAALGGLSDHSGTIWAGLGAVAMGISVLEVHVCWSKSEAGFDVEAALTVDEVGELVRGVSFIERAKTLVSKNEMAGRLGGMRELFMVTE